VYRLASIITLSGGKKCVQKFDPETRWKVTNQKIEKEKRKNIKMTVGVCVCKDWREM